MIREKLNEIRYLDYDYSRKKPKNPRVLHVLIGL